MDRRTFMKKSIDWIRKAAILGLLPISMRNYAMASSEKNTRAQFKYLSLREMTAEKLHHHNGRYLNPFTSKKHGNLWRVLYWKLFTKNHFKSHYHKEQVVSVQVDWKPLRDLNDCAITFLKHATVMIKDRDKYFLVDPILYDLFFFKDFSPLSHVKEIPPPDHILITHGHYDHLDKPSLKSFKKDTHVISPLGYDSVFEDLSMTNRTQLDWFDIWEDGEREIVFLPSHHWTMRNPLTGPNDSLWGSFLLKTASGPSIFISGDLAYFDHFNEIGNDYSIDLAIFNVGAYEPRWFMASSHINPEETVKAFLELKAKYLLVVHWGTFRLGDEPVHFPPNEIRSEMQKKGILDRLLHVNHGQTLLYDRSDRVEIMANG
jgi:L-ascorbate metabolism protein UlaG (beta-lactamase superfamily)